MIHREVKTEIREVQNLKNSAKNWVLQWQSPVMSAPAFWYFETFAEARTAEQNLQTQNRLGKDLR